MEEQKTSNAEALAGLLIIGCTVYGAAKLAGAVATGVVNGTMWAGEKIYSAYKKERKNKQR